MSYNIGSRDIHNTVRGMNVALAKVNRARKKARGRANITRRLALKLESECNYS